MTVKTSRGQLLASSKAADTLLEVQLHPLVILTISDYVTRHTLRKQQGPVVGAILGFQNGRTITMEHAFECKVKNNNEGEVLMDPTWFDSRLGQYKEVLKSPPLELVGWFTLASHSDPQQQHLPIHRQLSSTYNESLLFLTFDPLSVHEGRSRNKLGEKLPITIFETVYEASADDEDKTMGATGEAPKLQERFRELPYTIETGEAEMISVDFVARGPANAAISARQQQDAPANAKEKSAGSSKGKSKAEAPPPASDTPTLSPEDEEAIAALTTKANAIRMLHQRVKLLRSYLQSLPPCYLNDPSITALEPNPQISYPILRSIQSLLARLPLLTPSDAAPLIPSSTATQQQTAADGVAPLPPHHASTSTFALEASAERTDVALVSLLGSMGQTLKHAQELGRRAKIVEDAKRHSSAAGAGGAGGGKGNLWATLDEQDPVGAEMGYGAQSGGDSGFASPTRR